MIWVKNQQDLCVLQEKFFPPLNAWLCPHTTLGSSEMGTMFLLTSGSHFERLPIQRNPRECCWLVFELYRVPGQSVDQVQLTFVIPSGTGIISRLREKWRIVQSPTQYLMTSDYLPLFWYLHFQGFSICLVFSSVTSNLRTAQAVEPGAGASDQSAMWSAGNQPHSV